MWWSFIIWRLTKPSRSPTHTARYFKYLRSLYYNFSKFNYNFISRFSYNCVVVWIVWTACIAAVRTFCVPSRRKKWHDKSKLYMKSVFLATCKQPFDYMRYILLPPPLNLNKHTSLIACDLFPYTFIDLYKNGKGEALIWEYRIISHIYISVFPRMQVVLSISSPFSTSTSYITRWRALICMGLDMQN
jgi:hypothetical protein